MKIINFLRDQQKIIHDARKITKSWKLRKRENNLVLMQIMEYDIRD